MESPELEVHPPSAPPPLLDTPQIITLCTHGWLHFNLPQQLAEDIRQLTKDAATFFEQDVATKASIFPPSQGTEFGYYDVPNEKEYITFRRAFSTSSDLQVQTARVWKEIAQVLHRVLCDLSRVGGLDQRAWDPIVDGSLSFPDGSADLQNVTSLMRLFRYEPGTGIAEQHTDLGLLTLCVGTGRGLEVLDRSQKPSAWVDASDCAILVGETLRKLSQDNIRPGAHRVVGNPNGRQSLVFALRPNLAANVDSSNFGGQGTVRLRQLFTDIKGSKYNINARQEVREQQQQQQQQQARQRKEEGAKCNTSPR